MEALEQYIHAHTAPEEELLQELDRVTHQRMVAPRMLSGHLQGKLLTLLTRSMLFGGLLALEWGAYLLLDFFYSYQIAKEKGVKFFLVEVILYPAFHFAYGFGSLVGIANLPKFLKAERDKKKAGKENAR